MALDHDGPPEDAPKGYLPWFEVPRRRNADHTVVFGHWAALGLCVGDNVFGLDSGCSWGRTLTALRLDDRTLFEEPLADRMP
jgi:bis(5'-nucleosyl)-tetraphosphatase (symmetrical)